MSRSSALGQAEFERRLSRTGKGHVQLHAELCNHAPTPHLVWGADHSVHAEQAITS